MPDVGKRLVPSTTGELAAVTPFVSALTGEKIRWSEIAKKLNRRDDSCMRQWKVKAPTDKQLMQKTVHVKHRECLRTNYVDTLSRRRANVTVEVRSTVNSHELLIPCRVSYRMLFYKT